MNPHVSIIVPARNAGRTLGLLLDDLAGMDTAQAEILVVDDGSTDDTAEVVRTHQSRVPWLRLIDGPGRGPAAARNVGANAARAPWLAFVDADVRLPQNWVAEGLAALNGDVDVVEGSVAVRGGDTQGLVRHWALTDGNGVFVTANLWVRKAAFDAVGGFDEGYTVPWREDTDFGWRLVASGARTATRTSLVAYHPYYRRPVSSLLHTGPKLVADARLRSKFPDQARALQPRRELRRAYVGVVLLVAAVVALVLGATLAAVVLVVASELAAVAAVLPMAAYRGTTQVGEWAELVLLALPICVSRVYWVVRSNLEYRLRFW